MMATSAQARIAVHRSWAKTRDRTARTAPARAALVAKFEREVDPEGVLPPEERSRRAEHARTAHYTELSLRAVAVRQARAAAKRVGGTANASGSDIEKAAS